ncbi:MAG: hypothetical protein NTW26_00605 [bacterium]|nr:hypothetical protein [bacterium]
MGKHSLYGYPPDDDWPVLRTNLDPAIQYVYNVVILPAPYMQVPPPPPGIAWAKTVNFIGAPEYWWSYNPYEYRFELNRQPPPLYVGVFNNFPHPCGPRQGHPPYWPDPDDVCHVDWCKRSLWPQYLDEAEHGDMRLNMLINDWGTWEELFSEYIQTIPRWVQ